MPTIFLVRHGQASFGRPVYDRLSEAGRKQSTALGAFFRNHVGGKPARIIAGSLERQSDTAQLTRSEAGWQTGVTTDERWNEYDSDSMVQLGDSQGDPSSSTDYQRIIEAGMRLWATEDQHRSAYREFASRTDEALSELAALPGTSIVFSSAGVISHLATSLIDGTTETWVKLCRVAANTGVTTVAAGRQGINLVSFNQTSHLSGRLLTYR
ncbi:histidine phosphatase family protein [Brevibacterium ravenspurgense]|uniref:histidine phosphatase family protein n=1 Tax=Brevibacterium ravenspurgense TaxID=479117 RepID=UPI001EF18A44|nr:histidine phosphatase family protein [Brevibacterium ravenspurgense]MCG7299790.1 histidine phosphatase family protein [Brevibacterium ravenspurgense]